MPRHHHHHHHHHHTWHPKGILAPDVLERNNTVPNAHASARDGGASLQRTKEKKKHRSTPPLQPTQPVGTEHCSFDPQGKSKIPTRRTDQRSPPRYTPFRAGIFLICTVCSSCCPVEATILHYLAHASCYGSVLYRSCTTYHNTVRLGPTVGLSRSGSRSSSVRRVEDSKIKAKRFYPPFLFPRGPRVGRVEPPPRWRRSNSSPTYVFRGLRWVQGSLPMRMAYDMARSNQGKTISCMYVHDLLPHP